MAKITFSKLKMKVKNPPVKVEIPDTDITLDVLTYLPQAEKANFITFVIQHAMDDRGCFSPIRLETFFSIAMAKWYGQINFTDKQIQDAPKTYDILQSNDVFNLIVNNIPEDEYRFIEDAVNDTAKDIARFNNSAAGLLAAMNTDAMSLDGELSSIFEKIKNKEGLEELAAIRDMMGKAD